MKKKLTATILMMAVTVMAADWVACDKCGHAVLKERAKIIPAQDKFMIGGFDPGFRTFCEADAPRCDYMEMVRDEHLEKVWKYYKTNAVVKIEKTEVREDGTPKTDIYYTISTNIAIAVTNITIWSR